MHTHTSTAAFYFEVTKDRLYVEKADSHTRRSAQTALYHICNALTKSVAPALPHLAEDVWMHHVSTGRTRDSVFATGTRLCARARARACVCVVLCGLL